jgi:ATP-dependent RNA helicase DDX5/DBP2
MTYGGWNSTSNKNKGSSWNSSYYKDSGNWNYKANERWNKTGKTHEFSPIEWNVVIPTLPEFDKDFYIPHPDVESRPEEEVTELLKKNKIQVIHRGKDPKSEKRVPKPVTNLIEASFPEYITAKLCQELGGPRTAPTAVQKLLWPTALSGRDCLAIAPTGTGKTLGYLLPAIVHISASPPVTPEDKSPIVLIIAPTRELAVQIMEQASLYGSTITDVGGQALTPVCLFGGVPKRDQQWELETKCPDLIVATPGRLMDFMSDGIVSLRRVTYFVLDEVDRLISADGKMKLMSNSFTLDIEEISSQIRPDRQTIMCSATCTPDILDLARKLCGNEPVYFQVAEEAQSEKLIVSENVEQTFIDAGDTRERRIDHLASEILPNTFTESLSRAEQKMIIFANSKEAVDNITDQLREAGWPAIGTHADKVQEEREWIYSNFKSGVCNILVATDVMARGMDFEDVRCVVNFDLPQSIESYIHRVGRTGRIGKKIKRGYALSFITSKEWDILPGLETMFKDCNLQVPDILKGKIDEFHRYRKY